MTEIVSGSWVTLHYRLSSTQGKQVYLDTFKATPACLQVGDGQINPNLEKVLLGLKEGQLHSFNLKPEQAFGAHHQDLLHWVPRSALAHEAELSLGKVVEMLGAGQVRMLGCVQALDEDRVLIDFNHPLSGQAVCFDVKIVAVMPPD